MVLVGFVYFRIFFFFFNYSAPTVIYSLSLHDALPIPGSLGGVFDDDGPVCGREVVKASHVHRRSEEHTSELQSRRDLVCRLLLEKKKKTYNRRLTRKKKTKNTQKR